MLAESRLDWGICVRVFLVMLLVLIAALVFSAAPASAHADHDHDRDTAVAQDADSPATASRHSGDSEHEVAHNSADHSHPIGDDTYHEKASHSSLDFAHHHTVAVKLAALPRAANLPVVDEAACGLALTPPIRPPLG